MTLWHWLKSSWFSWAFQPDAAAQCVYEEEKAAIANSSTDHQNTRQPGSSVGATSSDQRSDEGGPQCANDREQPVAQAVSAMLSSTEDAHQEVGMDRQAEGAASMAESVRLHEELSKVDPEMAKRLHPNNRRKIERWEYSSSYLVAWLYSMPVVWWRWSFTRPLDASDAFIPCCYFSLESSSEKMWHAFIELSGIAFTDALHTGPTWSIAGDPRPLSWSLPLVLLLGSSLHTIII